MTPILETILPIFLVIFLGWGLSSLGKISGAVVEEVNRLVFYVAIPAMIFSKVARVPFHSHFHPVLALGVLACAGAAFFAGIFLVRLLRVPRPLAGTFVQSGFHGNLGYVGLAVAYYFLGESGFAEAGILAAFLMLLQNVLAVTALSLYAPAGGREMTPAWRLKKIAGNPVILSAGAGVLFSMSGLSLPVVADRFLGIVSGMALPTALLVIGASLSFSVLRENLKWAAAAGAVKLVFLPALGYALFTVLDFPPQAVLPGIILLAAPTATITRVMAGEMGGSASLASAAVSANTLFSAATYVFWLTVAG
ncbi:MAG: AEC family transporter [Proteobacteria bacterium]|nr:AEC family transporter [Pseudomonadota bacterium]